MTALLHRELMTTASRPDSIRQEGVSFMTVCAELAEKSATAALQLEWQDRLRSLEDWVCELLIKNQQLRMALAEARAAEPRDDDD